MAIYDYDDSSAKRYESIHQCCAIPRSTPGQPKPSKTMLKIASGDYQGALDSIGKDESDLTSVNTRAVLLLRLGRGETAANLLRNVVWDLKSFTMKPDVPTHIQLNYATGLLMSGHVAGCLEVIRAIGKRENDQAAELQTQIRNWEKSLSVLRWLDWKICGIEHSRLAASSNSVLGRFGWESKTDKAVDRADANESPATPMHDLAC